MLFCSRKHFGIKRTYCKTNINQSQCELLFQGGACETAVRFFVTPPFIFWIRFQFGCPFTIQRELGQVHDIPFCSAIFVFWPSDTYHHIADRGQPIISSLSRAFKKQSSSMIDCVFSKEQGLPSIQFLMGSISLDIQDPPEIPGEEVRKEPLKAFRLRRCEWGFIHTDPQQVFGCPGYVSIMVFYFYIFLRIKNTFESMMIFQTSQGITYHLDPPPNHLDPPPNQYNNGK